MPGRRKKIKSIKKTKTFKVEISSTPLCGLCLTLNGVLQQTQYDEFIYHEALIHPAMITHGSVKEILIIGGATGAAARETLKYKNIRRTAVINNDAVFVDLCRKHLRTWHSGAFSSPRTRLLIGDAQVFVDTVEQKFDFIALDLPSVRPSETVKRLYKKEFFNALKRRLRPDGVIVVNAGFCDKSRIKFHRELIKSLKGSFRYCLPYYVFLPSVCGTNMFLYCSNHINPVKLGKDPVNKRIRKLTRKRNRFYNGDAHEVLFK